MAGLVAGAVTGVMAKSAFDNAVSHGAVPTAREHVRMYRCARRFLATRPATVTPCIAWWGPKASLRLLIGDFEDGCKIVL